VFVPLNPCCRLPLGNGRGLQLNQSLDITALITLYCAQTTHKFSRGAKEKIITSDWFRVTTIEKSQASTNLICKFGHKRWDIENQGFNYSGTFFNIDHCFHHHQNAIPAFSLIAFIAYILIQAFHKLNLKPQRRAKICLYGIIQELSLSFWPDLAKMKPEPRASPQL
jgi:hypothetical protein